MLPEGDEELQDDEPFVPDWPARDRARRARAAAPARRRIARRRSARSPAPASSIRRGASAISSWSRSCSGSAISPRALAPALAEPKLDPVSATLEFAIDGEPWRLTGGFGDLRSSGLIRYRYDDARAGDYLERLDRAPVPERDGAGRASPPRTTWHSRDGHYVLPPVEDARAQLAALLALYRDGLHRPLHFFPKSAWAYVGNERSLAQGRRHVAAARASASTAKTATRPTAWRCAAWTTRSTTNSTQCATTVFAPLLDVIDDDRLRGRA